MIVTPTNTGSMIAGAGVGLFGWSLAEKGNKIPFVKTFYTEVRKETAVHVDERQQEHGAVGARGVQLRDARDHRSRTPLLFALGNTVVNILGLWVYLPLRQRRANKARTQAILRGVKA